MAMTVTTSLAQTILHTFYSAVKINKHKVKYPASIYFTIRITTAALIWSKKRKKNKFLLHYKVTSELFATLQNYVINMQE